MGDGPPISTTFSAASPRIVSVANDCRAVDKLASVRLSYCRLVDLTRCKIEAAEILVCGEARHFGVISNGPHFAFRDLCLEEL